MNAPLRSSLRPRAFSLVEVMLALGITAFCLLSLILLLPIGMSANQSSIGKTVGTGLATEIANQLQSAASYYSVSNATPAGSLFTLPGRGQGTGAAGAMNTLFYDGNGAPIGTVGSSATPAARYRATVVFSPQAKSTAAVPVRILVTWPALADPDPMSYPKNHAGFVEVVTSCKPY